MAPSASTAKKTEELSFGDRLGELIEKVRGRSLSSVLAVTLLLLVIALALLVASAQFTGDISLAFKAAEAMFGLLALASWARAATSTASAAKRSAHARSFSRSTA